LPRSRGSVSCCQNAPEAYYWTRQPTGSALRAAGPSCSLRIVFAPEQPCRRSTHRHAADLLTLRNVQPLLYSRPVGLNPNYWTIGPSSRWRSQHRALQFSIACMASAASNVVNVEVRWRRTESVATNSRGGQKACASPRERSTARTNPAHHSDLRPIVRGYREAAHSTRANASCPPLLQRLGGRVDGRSQVPVSKHLRQGCLLLDTCDKLLAIAPEIGAGKTRFINVKPPEHLLASCSLNTTRRSSSLGVQFCFSHIAKGSRGGWD